MRHSESALKILGILLIHAGLALTSPPEVRAAATFHPSLERINPSAGLSGRFLTQRAGAEPLVNLIVEGSASAADGLRARGVEVNTWTSAGMTARCPLSLLSTLRYFPGVTAVHPATRCRLYLDRSAVDTDVATVRASVPPLFAGQSGAGVLVGLVDSGLDLKHGDFRKPDKSTRLISAWDQTDAGTPPHGFTYGVEWSAASIDGNVATMTDGFGHGTHVLGIAAGDGSAAGHGQPPFTYVGMAPEADLCVVKTDLTVSGIVDAVSYIFQVAASRGQPAVVNLSLGTQEGPHDGTLAMDLMLNALTGPGRIVVAAAGNEEADNVHARLTIAPPTSQSMTLIVPTYTPSPGAVDDYIIVSGWYPSVDQMSVSLITPGGTVLGPVAPGDSLTSQSTPYGFIDLYNNTQAAVSGDHEAYVQIYDPPGSSSPAPGAWRLQFTPLSIVGSGVVDAYVETSHLGDGSALAGWTVGRVTGGVIASPGDADSIITVGAHVTKVCWSALNGFTRCFNPAPALGSLVRFSSQGPRRDGALKPDLTAPGLGIVSSRSSTAFYSPDEVTPDGSHAILSGTSMSTPHVTGAVALLLSHSANAAAYPSQIRAMLEQAARSDGQTGAVPNPAWGHGKLDIAAALGPALNVSVPRPAGGHVAVFGTQDSVEVHVAGGPADSVVVFLSRDGGISYTRRLGVLGPMADGETRALAFFTDPAWSTYHARVRCVAFNPSMGNLVAFSDSSYSIGPELQDALRAPAPNPFRSVTAVHFDLLQPAHVTIRIYSVRGTLVRTLVDGAYPAGRQSLDWNGSDDRGRATSSGIYFCEFRAGPKREVRRLVLTR